MKIRTGRVAKPAGQVRFNWRQFDWRCGGVALAGLWLMSAAPVVAQNAEDLNLSVGKSVVLDYPEDIRQISTSDPMVVDANPVTTREVLLSAKGLGSATMVVWTTSNQRMFYNVTVGLNVDPLRRMLRETFPNETIEVRTSGESVSLNGTVSTKEVSDRAAALAAAFAMTVVNNLNLAPGKIEQQVLLRVKFAELDRVRAAQYGVNIFSTGATNTLGRVTTGQFNSGNITTNTTGTTSRPQLSISDALNIFLLRPDLNLAAMIRALQSENILQILSEPNLVSSNLKEASFLVGGEFPIPVLQGGANSGAVTIQFREFGIRLRFTPEITGNDTIKLALNQEVSSIDTSNGVSVSGFFIPALATRRTETFVELGDGQSFIVSGLLDNQERELLNKMPVISSIPVLGALFKSKEERKSQTELVMLVTPEITQPLGPNDPRPEIPFPRDFLERLTPEQIQGAAPASGSDRIVAAKK